MKAPQEIDPGLAQLADAVLIPPFPGHEAPPWILAALGDGLAGVTLFGLNVGSPAQLAGLTATLRAAGLEAAGLAAAGAGTVPGAVPGLVPGSVPGAVPGSVPGYYNNYNMQMMTMGMQNMHMGQPMYPPQNPYANYGPMYQQPLRDSQARVIQQRRQNDGEGKQLISTN